MSTVVGSQELGRRIRRSRTERHLTLKQVEESSGLSATHLSEIERGRTSPTIGALTRIARALGRDAAYFIEAEDLPEIAHVSGDHLPAFSTRGGARVEALTPGVPGHGIFAYRIALGPRDGGRFSLPALDMAGEALYLVRDGRVETTIGETSLTLAAGDAAHALRSWPHELRAADGTAAEVIAILTRRLEESA